MCHPKDRRLFSEPLPSESYRTGVRGSVWLRLWMLSASYLPREIRSVRRSGCRHIKLQEEEVSDIRWFTKQEIYERINNNYNGITPRSGVWKFLKICYEKGGM